MKIKIIREPILLLETVAMICHYFRGESYAATTERLLNKFGDALKPSQRKELSRNGDLAEKLMNAICSDIDLENKDFAFFFKPFDTGNEMERNCIAKVLIFSMLNLRPADLDTAVKHAKESWDYALSDGMEVLHFHMHGLNFIHANGRELPTLFEQIYALDYPHKAKMESFLVIEQHDRYLDKLAELIRPYAQRLSSSMDVLAPIYAASADYWELTLNSMTAKQISALMRIDEKAQLNMLAKAYISLFLFNELGNSFDNIMAVSPDEITAVYIGMGIYPEYTMVLSEQLNDRISEAIRALADPVRIEILSRLNKEPNYCLNLAQSMELNTGNISRHLSLLYDNGFLDRERSDGRIYFETNMDMISRTFSNFMSLIND